MTKLNKRLIIRILLLISIIWWMSIIFRFSAQTGTSSASSSHSVIYLIGKITKNITGHNIILSLTPIQFKRVEFVIRKMAHMFIYFMLSILVILFLFTYNNSIKMKIFLTFSTSFLYACSDEIHQYFVGGRSASFKDVLIDTTGACIGILLILIIYYFIKKHKAVN